MKRMVHIQAQNLILVATNYTYTHLFGAKVFPLKSIRYEESGISYS